MTNVRTIVRAARLAAVLAAALAISACSHQAENAQANAGAMATPGSQQDFVVNVGDRVWFDTDSTELSAQSRATLDKQAQWLTTYQQYSQFTIEGHADERGTREYNLALGARRAQTVRDYLDLARRGGQPHAHHLLRQGASGRGVRRHLLLVAEPPRGHGAQREFVNTERLYG